MYKPISIILLVIFFTNCKKENHISEQSTAFHLTQITSVNNGYQEFFTHDNELLSNYSVDIYGTGAITYTIEYDSQSRPALIQKNGTVCASFSYHQSSVSLFIEDGLTDSLFYTMGNTGKIVRLEKYDDLHGTMQKNADKYYRYNGNNLIEIECTEYNPSGTVKLNYVESATFDTRLNAFESIDASPIVLEFLFQHIPLRIFKANSKNNITHLESTHPSDGYTLMQNIVYENMSYPSEVHYLKQQYGFMDEDILIYSYSD